MGRSVSKSTLGTWLTKKAWLSLAAVVVGLLAASIGMSLPGSSVVSAQSNSAPTVSISSPSSPASVYADESETFTATATDSDNNLSTWKWEARRDRIFPLPDFVYTPGEQTFDTAPTGSVTKDFSYTFTDSEGESGYVDRIVEVKDGPDPALEKIGLVSRKPYSEVGRLIPPPTVGRSFDIEVDLKNLS